MPQWSGLQNVGDVEPTVSVYRNAMLVIVVPQESDHDLGELDLQVVIQSLVLCVNLQGFSQLRER